MKLKQFFVVVFETAYLFFFYTGVLSIVMPGEPMKWGFKVGLALTALLNFGIVLLLTCKNILSKKTITVLFAFIIVFSFPYLKAGARDFILFLSDGNIQRSEHLISFLLCIEEVCLHIICLLAA